VTLLTLRTKYLETCQEALDYLLNNNAPHVVITGGEPSSQKNAIALINYIEDFGKRVTIETNGTQFFESKATLISMSPKLASSSSGLKALSDPNYQQQDTNSFLNTEDFEKRARLYSKFLETHESARYNLESMKKFMEYYGPDRYQFKFVVNTEEDVQEILSKYIEPLKIPNDNVFLMPQGISHAQLNSRAAWVMEQCRIHGFHYSDRLHIRVYGNKSGV
jgi:7-carboxy-7-deazaguanine synthase